MNIDWFTIVAQILNFLILVWLMKRFLYKPILNAIDEREKRIAAELANADKKKSDAQKESDELKKKNKEFDDHRSALLDKVNAEVQAERERLLREAKKSAAELTLKQQESLKNEMQNLNKSIQSRVEQEVFAITRKVLTDLASKNLEEQVVERFTDHLHALDEKKKNLLISSLNSNPSSETKSLTARTAFELSANLQTKIENALKDVFKEKIKIQFATAPELINGIELVVNGQKVAWSVSEYLGTLEKDIHRLLEEVHENNS